LEMATRTSSKPGPRRGCRALFFWPGICAAIRIGRRRKDFRRLVCLRPFDPVPPWPGRRSYYASMRTFFRAESVKPYRVFLRGNPVNPNGGVGLMNSFFCDLR
jgi:hypothetical protein